MHERDLNKRIEKEEERFQGNSKAREKVNE